MRTAYQSQTVAIDGIALRAPPAILAELGFNQDLIEAFGLPAFEEIEYVDEEAEERKRQMKEREEMEGFLDEEARKNAEAAQKAEEEARAAAEAGIDLGEGEEVDPLQVPPRLDEIMGDTRTEGWKHRNRRNAMGGGREGVAMDRGSVLQAERVASTLQMADLQEEDEVEEWLAKAAERREREGEGGGMEKITEFGHLDVDGKKLDEERTYIEGKFSKRLHATALAGALELLPNEGKKVDDTPSQSSEEDHPHMHGDLLGEEHTDWHARDHHKPGMMVFDPNRHKDLDADDPNRQLSPEELEARRRAMWAEGEDQEQQDQGPIPYGGKVYPGMKVRPRGMGTPRRDLVGAEMMRSAYLAEAKDGVTGWGRVAYTKAHYNAPNNDEEHEAGGGEAGGGEAQAQLEAGETKGRSKGVGSGPTSPPKAIEDKHAARPGASSASLGR